MNFAEASHYISDCPDKGCMKCVEFCVLYEAQDARLMALNRFHNAASWSLRERLKDSYNCERNRGANPITAALSAILWDIVGV